MKKNEIIIEIVILFLLIFGFGNVNAQLADSPWPTFRGNLKNTGLSPYDTSHVDGTVKWVFKVDDEFESSPTIGSDGTIYLGSHKNKLYALNSDGTLKWKFNAGEPIYDPVYDVWKGILSSPAISEDGTIYIRSLSNFLFAINPDGTEKWRFPIKSTVDTWSSPTIGEDGTIYVGSARGEGIGGKIYAINPENGSEKWGFQAESDVFPTPAIGDDGTIYSGNGATGDFYAIKSDGGLKWKINTGKHIETSAAIGADGTIYVGSWNNYFYAFTPDGKKKWDFLTKGNGLVSSPAIGKDGTIYLAANDGDLYALNPDGKEKWKYSLGDFKETSSSPTIGADGTIYVGAPYTSKDNPTFFAINLDGTKKWSYKTQGGISASPTIGKDGTVYVSSYSGEVYAFTGSVAENNFEEKVEKSSAAQLADSPWPTYKGNSKHTGLSPYAAQIDEPELKWKFNAGNGVETSPAIGADGTIYFGVFKDNFFALNPDGTEKWRFTREGEEFRSSPTIAKDGTIYLGAVFDLKPVYNILYKKEMDFGVPKVYALNPDGTVKWEFVTGGILGGTYAAPTIGPDGTIYIGAGGARMTAYAKGGNRFWAINPTDGTAKWFFETGDVIYSTAAIGDDGTIYFGGGDGNVYALTPEGKEKWRFPKKNEYFDGTPAIGVDGTIYIGSTNKNLYALTPEGKEKWHFTALDMVEATPSIGPDGTIYMGTIDKGSKDHYLYALNPNGTLKWKFEAGDGVYATPAIDANGIIYFGSYDYSLYALNPNGTKKWQYKVGGGLSQPPVISKDGTIYFGAWDNHLYAISGSSDEKETKTIQGETDKTLEESIPTKTQSEESELTKNSKEQLAKSAIKEKSSEEAIAPEKAETEQTNKDESLTYVIGAVLIVVVIGIVIVLKKWKK